jgi:hypothetical protein
MSLDTIIMAEWRAEERADGCYVFETQPGIEGHTEFGPMDEGLVLTLISARRDAYEATCSRGSAQLFSHAC